MDERYRLYEAAVQTPELDVEILERIFRRRRGCVPLTLREDFCGTAALAAAWVGSHDDREAEAVDRDREVLAVARARRGELEEDGERLVLRRADARSASDRTFDLVTAMNFSWAIFDDRALARYFRAARENLEDDGLLVLELFGGREMERPLAREHAFEGFTYVWEQRAFEGGVLDARIHFRKGRRVLRDAFAYRFHLRPLARLRELLARAGLGAIDLYVEDERGGYRKRRGEPRAPLWRGLLVCGAR